MNLKNIVEILVRYDVKHIPFVTNMHYELTNPDLMLSGLCADHEKMIYLDSNMCDDHMRLTIIHEALHCHSFMYGLGWSEREVTKRAKDLFKETYGWKP